MTSTSPDTMASVSGRALFARSILVFLAARVVMLPIFLLAWSRQGPNASSYPTARPDFLTFLSLSWDGYWYHLIATEGYPSALPTGPTSGTVGQSSWAFYPLYPSLVAGLTRLGLDYAPASLLVAIASGALAAGVLALLVKDVSALKPVTGPGSPILAVWALCLFPAAAVMSVGYSDATALLLILLSLYAIRRQRYLLAVVPILLLGFARGVALPMVAVVIWHAFRLWSDSRSPGAERVSKSRWLAMGAAAAAAAVSGVLWPVIAAVVTGVPNAYLITQSAWRADGGAPTAFSSVIRKLTELFGPLGVPVLVVAILAVIGLSLTPAIHRYGPELQAWGAAYTVYILAVSELGSPIVRYFWLSISFPLVAASWTKMRWLQVASLALLAAAQVAWVLIIWVYNGRGDAFPP